MSGASTPPPPEAARSAGAAGVAVPGSVGDSCPLCGAPLRPEQEWCLRCGAAARTRLATSPNWRAPIIAIAVVATLSLGVLAAALVKLAGNSGSPATPATTAVAGAASVTSPGTATETPAPSATSPGATTPGASASGTVAPVALMPATAISSSAATLNGTVNPQGVPTSYQFRVRTPASRSWGAVHAPVPLGAGTSAIGVNSRIAYLTPGTTYHYELVAVKAGRAISTRDATFTTASAH